MSEGRKRVGDSACPGGCGTLIEWNLIACEACFPYVLLMGPYATAQQIRAFMLEHPPQLESAPDVWAETDEDEQAA